MCERGFFVCPSSLISTIMRENTSIRRDNLHQVSSYRVHSNTVVSSNLKTNDFHDKKWLNFYFEMFYHIQYTRNTYWCSAAVVLNFWLFNYLEMLPWIKVPSDIPAVLCKGCRMWWISKCFNISPIKYVMIKNWRYRMNHDCVNIATTSISQTLSSSMRHL